MRHKKSPEITYDLRTILWSRGKDKTPTFEAILGELKNIQFAITKLKSISMYDDKKLLRIKL